MALTKLYKPTREPMRIVGLMSGSGTNLRRILEHQETLRAQHGVPPYVVVAIFTDNAASKAVEIGRDHDLPVLMHDIERFYARRGMRKTMHGEGAALRVEFDAKTVKALGPYAAAVAAYAGYMSAASEILVDTFLGVNVHPADLTKKREDGRPIFTGDKAVLRALRAGAAELRASTHLIAREVDQGPVLMVSAPLPVVRDESKPLEQLADEHQSRLKEVGDWRIFPRTLQYLAEGRFARDEAGLLHFDGQPIPDGLREEG